MKMNKKQSTLLLATCFALSVIITFILSRQFQPSSDTNSKLLRTSDVPGLSLGEIVNVPKFENLRGQAQSVQPGPSGYALLIIFSTRCEACQKDSAFWNKLALEAVKTKTSYYLVCANVERDEIENFIGRLGLGNQTVLIDSKNELPTMLKNMFVPQYLLLNNEGRVAGRWLGLSHSDPQGVKVVEASDMLSPAKQTYDGGLTIR